MEYRFFALISRMKYISRWELMRNTRDENIAEHSHMAAIIAHALSVIGREIFGKDISPDSVAAKALYHDASEILTGDLPTPVKYHNPEISRAYKRLESVSCEKLVSLLPEALKGTYADLMFQENFDEYELLIIKAADKLSAYIKCVEELKTGNNEFRKAAEQIKRALSESPLPEVSYFMEHFMPAFELTLDDLSD